MIRKAMLLAVVAAMLPAAAFAAKRESIYSDMGGKGCDGDAEGIFSCKGPAGWQLEILDEGNIIQLRISRVATPEVALELTGRGLGEKAEWRGTRSRKGFKPDAMIVRMRPVEGDEKMSSLLFIVKLHASEACLHGIVDAKVNKNANMLARAAADKLPDVCEEYPRVYGQRSAATDMFGT